MMDSICYLIFQLVLAMSIICGVAQRRAASIFNTNRVLEKSFITLTVGRINPSSHNLHQTSLTGLELGWVRSAIIIYLGLLILSRILYRPITKD